MIREAVLSLVANQTAGVEIIVADDCSPRQGEVRAAIADLIEAGRVAFIGHEQNCGWSENRNSLVRAARGEWIMLLGDDDRLKPGALDRIRRWMEAHPGGAAYGVGYDVIDEEGAYCYRRRSPRRVAYRLGEGDAWKELFYFDALPMWSHHPFTMCIRRDVALAHPYNPGMGIADDVLFLFELLLNGHRFDVIPESLFEWRRAIRMSGPYRGLSGDSRKSTEGQLRVLGQLVKLRNRFTELDRLVGTETFIRRFLKTDAATARAIAAEVRQRGVTERTPGDVPAVASGGVAGSLAQVARHVRIARVLGGGHWRQVLQCAWDRRHHRDSMPGTGQC